MEGINIYIEDKEFYIDTVKNKDIDNIVDIYNSNKQFLKSHINKTNVSSEWIENELKIMKQEGFYSTKITRKSDNNIVGIVDFKLDKEAYLSLIMLNNEFKKQGIGKRIYTLFEDYVKGLGIKTIRIDAAKDYNKVVLEFWLKNKFKVHEEITLSWNDNIFKALVMKKTI